MQSFFFFFWCSQFKISLILVLDLGLLAMTTYCEDKAHELLEESLRPLSEALKFGSEISKISHV